MSWEAIGALSGVAAIFISVLLWWLDRRHKGQAPGLVELSGLKVSTSFGFLAFENRRSLSEDQMLFINVVNPTSRRYRVDSIGLTVEGTGQQLVQPRIESDRGIPVVLDETEKVMCWMPINHIAHALVNSGIDRPIRLRAYAGDSYNHRHLSDWTEFDPKGVLRGAS